MYDDYVFIPIMNQVSLLYNQCYRREYSLSISPLGVDERKMFLIKSPFKKKTPNFSMILDLLDYNN